jgi:hypothetical protein
MRSFVASVRLALLSVATLHAQQQLPTHSQQDSDCLRAAEQQFRDAGFSHDNASLTAHYSTSLSKCFAEFATTKFEDAHWEFVREVVDTANGATVGQITWIHGTMLLGANSTLCRVVTPSGITLTCRRLYEFEDIVKNYYGIQ